MTRDHTGPHFPGSLRDWFAGQVLSGETANVWWDRTTEKQKRIAEWCYYQADAMMAARVGRKPPWAKATEKRLAEMRLAESEAKEDKTDG